MTAAPSLFEGVHSELVLEPVNGDGNGGGESRKAFLCSIEVLKNRGGALVEL